MIIDHLVLTTISDFGSYVIRIENLPCPPNTTAGCQADVYLERVLIPGQTFQFRITVRDTKGDTTTVPVRLVATEARSDVETVFPHIPAIIIVPEVHCTNKIDIDLVFIASETSLTRSHFALISSQKLSYRNAHLILIKKKKTKQFWDFSDFFF